MIAVIDKFATSGAVMDIAPLLYAYTLDSFVGKNQKNRKIETISRDE